MTAAAESLDVQAVAGDTDAVYPVFVDPAWSSQDNDHWYDDAAYPNQSYLNGNENSSWLATGHAVQDGISYTSRAFWQFPTGPLEGKTITAAHLTVNETETFDTSDTVGLYLIETPRLTDGATWNQENATSNVWAHLQHTFTPASGANTFDVANAVTWGVGASDSGLQFGLKASDESSTSSRKHWALAASLAVTYNTKPDAPTSLQIETPARGCGTSSSPVYLNNAVQAIALEAKASDPDPGDTLTTTFKVSGPMTPAKDPVSAAGASGTTEVGTIGKGVLTKDGLYTWTAVSTDEHGLGGATSSACYLYVENDGPAWPTVTGPTSGPFYVETPITFNVAFVDTDKVARLEYWWANGAGAGSVATNPPLPTSYVNGTLPGCGPQGRYTFMCVSGTSAEFKTAPPDTSSVLWVAAIDQAGNISASPTGTTAGHWLPPANYPIQRDQNDTAANAHQWLTRATDPSATVVADTNTVNEQDVTVAAGLPLAASGGPHGTGDNDVLAGQSAFSLPGYGLLERAYKSPDRESAVEGAVSSGYARQMDLGYLIPLEQKGSLPASSDTKELYECPGSGDETSSVSACTGQVQLGYIWDQPTDVPSGMTAVPLNSCVYASTGDHFDSTSSTCEGQTLVSNLGYLVDLGANATTGQVIDTTKSYTVAAWVYPEQPAGGTMYHTILSESGAVDAGFYFQEASPANDGSTSGGSLRLCAYTQTTPVTAVCTPVSTTMDLTLKSWAFVVGTWNAADDLLSVCLGTGSVTCETASDTVLGSTPSATGPVIVGGAMSSTLAANQWSGLIVDPTIVQGVMDNDQLIQLSNQQPIF